MLNKGIPQQVLLWELAKEIRVLMNHTANLFQRKVNLILEMLINK